MTAPAAEPSAPVRTTRWHGTFISAAHPSAEGDPAVYFRRGFDLDSRPLRATLEITALGIVVPFLNGARVGDEVLAPGWTTYRHRLVVSTYDVTDLIVPGTNVLGAIVGEGWAVGALTWENLRHYYSDRPALYAQLTLELADRTEVITTDDRFGVGTGGVRGSGIYDGETFDARLEPDGWNRAGFDDSDWTPAQPFAWDTAALIDPVAPPIRRIEVLRPAAILTSPSGATILDFGQNISGWVRLTVTGQAGEEIVLHHAEVLTPSGEIERETNRGAAATDRYVLRGGQPETWEPEFTYHGFRYVEVAGWPGQVTTDDVEAIVVHTDMKRSGWFESSNELVTQLHKNIVWSMRGNFVGVPTDCPQRDERLGWTGDINAFSPTAAFLYDVRGILGSWLQDLHADQSAAGTVPFVVPDVRALWTTPSATALWGDVAISLPWTLYREYGDLEILRDSYDSMTAFMDEVENGLDSAGLWTKGFQWGDWLDPDAPPSEPGAGKTNRYFLASAYLCKTSRELADTAQLLGNDSDAARYRALHEQVRSAFRREFVTESGRIVNETATGYAITITFDILDEDQLAKAGERLAAVVEEAGYRISTGFSGTPLVTHALSSTGQLETAYRLLLQTETPSFLYPVTQGATTVWERWDSILPDGTVNATGMTSLNHYALGAIGDWLHRVVAGLEAGEPGWRTFRIAPQPGGGLTWARAAHDTIYGRAEVHWRVEDGDMILDATVPAGATATVVLPLHPELLIEEVGPGSHTWRYLAPRGYGEATRLTMDTPLKRLLENEAVWTAVVEAFTRYLPDIPLDGMVSHLQDSSLASILERLPTDVPGFPSALEDALVSELTPRQRE